MLEALQICLLKKLWFVREEQRGARALSPSFLRPNTSQAWRFQRTYTMCTLSTLEGKVTPTTFVSEWRHAVFGIRLKALKNNTNN